MTKRARRYIYLAVAISFLIAILFSNFINFGENDMAGINLLFNYGKYTLIIPATALFIKYFSGEIEIKKILWLTAGIVSSIFLSRSIEAIDMLAKILMSFLGLLVVIILCKREQIP